jgi:hypothetical protein
MQDRLDWIENICKNCWDKFWEMPEWHLATFHYDECDICWEIASVTEPRDYGNLPKYIPND